MPAARGHSQRVNAAQDHALPRQRIRPLPGAPAHIQRPAKSEILRLEPACKPRLSRRVAFPLYLALVSLATLLAAGSDTRSIAEGHRQVAAENDRPLKGAWREAARLRQGLPALVTLETITLKDVAASLASVSQLPSAFDRPEALWHIAATSILSNPVPSNPAPASAVAWPDLPNLQPVPLQALALLSPLELKAAHPARPRFESGSEKAPQKGQPKKSKAAAVAEPPQKIKYVPKEAASEAEPAPVVVRAAAKVQTPAVPRQQPVEVIRSRTFEDISQSAP